LFVFTNQDYYAPLLMLSVKFEDVQHGRPTIITDPGGSGYLVAQAPDRKIEQGTHALVTKPPSGAAYDSALQGKWFSICTNVAEYFLIPTGHMAGGNL
jgi:hypothetical protein